MLRKLRAWAITLSRVGDSIRVGRQMDEFFRYYLIENLKQEGLFEFLKQPRTYGQILAELGYVDSDYTRSVFEALSSEKEPVIRKADNLYGVNPDVPLPNLDGRIDKAGKHVQPFALMAKGMTRYVPNRLRNQPVELSDTFEQDGRQLLNKFDKTLSSSIYPDLRSAVFAMLTREERSSLRGAHLLEVGCGSGRETAELWLRYDGDIYITAIDPTEGLLNMARQQFPDYLDEMALGHAPLTESNRPVFKQASATDLPFQDNTFDAAFCGFMLHWTPDARKAVKEIVRVVKPGGLIFGVQPLKPAARLYFDLVVRTNENSHGFFWKEEFRRWFRENGIDAEIETPVGLFRGRKPGKL